MADVLIVALGSFAASTSILRLVAPLVGTFFRRLTGRHKSKLKLTITSRGGGVTTLELSRSSVSEGDIHEILRALEEGPDESIPD